MATDLPRHDIMRHDRGSWTSVLYTQKDGEEVLQVISQTNTLLERSHTALKCSASLQLTIPTLVDKEDNAVNEAYAAWPDRLAVVGVDGRLAYFGGKGPGGFKPSEVEQWLVGFFHGRR